MSERDASGRRSSSPVNLTRRNALKMTGVGGMLGVVDSASAGTASEFDCPSDARQCLQDHALQTWDFDPDYPHRGAQFTQVAYYGPAATLKHGPESDEQVLHEFQLAGKAFHAVRATDGTWNPTNKHSVGFTVTGSNGCEKVQLATTPNPLTVGCTNADNPDDTTVKDLKETASGLKSLYDAVKNGADGKWLGGAYSLGGLDLVSAYKAFTARYSEPNDTVYEKDIPQTQLPSEVQDSSAIFYQAHVFVSVPRHVDHFDVTFEGRTTYKIQGEEPAATTLEFTGLQNYSQHCRTKPEVSISSNYEPDPATVGEPVTLTVNPSDPDNSEDYNSTKFEKFTWDGNLNRTDGSNVSVEDFDGDGLTESVVTTYDSAGTKTVECTVVDDEFQSRTGSYDLEVVERPNPTFTANDTYPSSHAATFDGSDSTGNIASYTWKLWEPTLDPTSDPPGTEASGETFEYTFGATGDYHVQLQATNDAGFSQSTTKKRVTVVENESPTDVSVSPNRNPVDLGQDVQFNAAATDPDSTDIESYSWSGDLNGGSRWDDGRSYVTSYDSAGTYSVTVTVDDGEGATASASTSVEVADKPEARFSLPGDAVLDGSTITLDGSSSTGDVVSYEWSVKRPNLEPATYSGETVEYNASPTGQHEVTLTVTDSAGYSGSTTKYLTVTDDVAPEITYLEPNRRPVSVGQSVQFGVEANDPDGGSLSYSWSGDLNGASAGDNPETLTTSYGSVGTRTVSVTVTDDEGNTTTGSTSVDVVRKPDAAFDVNGLLVSGETVELDASASSDDDGIASYDWSIWKPNFTDPITKSGRKVGMDCSVSGDYTVELTVTDVDGFASTLTKYPYVSADSAPTIDSFSASTSSTLVDDPVSFSVSASDDVQVAGYSWSGDLGGASPGDTTSFTTDWSTSGSKTVTVTVSDDDGRTTSQSTTVDVVNQAPSVSVSASDTTVYEGTTVDFTTNVSNDDGSVSYVWDGANKKSDPSKASQTWYSGGNYTVRVDVYDSEQKTDYDTVTVSVMEYDDGGGGGGGGDTSTTDDGGGGGCGSAGCIEQDVEGPPEPSTPTAPADDGGWLDDLGDTFLSLFGR